MEDQQGKVERTVKYTWTINNFSFSKFDCLYLSSETFFTGCHPWQIIVFPEGDDGDYLSIYLDSGDNDNFPDGWGRFAKFKLSLINQFNDKKTETCEDQCQFSNEAAVSGNQSFITLVNFRDPSNGFLVDDTCIIVAEVSVNGYGQDNHSPTQVYSASYVLTKEFATRVVEMEGQQGRVETIMKYTWTINNFSKLDCETLSSRTFFTGYHPWQIMVYPEGDEIDHLSIYLDSRDTGDFPDGWSRSAKFKLSVINQFNDKKTKTFEDQIQFDAEGPISGCRPFMPLVKFRNCNNGFLVDDTCIIVAEVSVSNSGHDNHSPTKMFSVSYGELTDFNGLCKVEKHFVQLLEEACLVHPTLIESQRKRKKTQRFTETSFRNLGRLLHFLKNKKVKDMDEDACDELRNLWEEVEIRFDDLTWLEPHVQSVLDIKRAARVKKLKENVAAAEANLEIARRELVKAEEGFVGEI